MIKKKTLDPIYFWKKNSFIFLGKYSLYILIAFFVKNHIGSQFIAQDRVFLDIWYEKSLERLLDLIKKYRIPGKYADGLRYCYTLKL